MLAIITIGRGSKSEVKKNLEKSVNKRLLILFGLLLFQEVEMRLGHYNDGNVTFM